jgi:hypothetical protein
MKIIVTILVILSFVSCRNTYDKEIWSKNANQNSDNPRFDMVKDLQQNYLLNGVSADKILDLLGKAESIDTTEFGIHWTYSVGSNPGLNIDPYYLVVDFDSIGHLTETRIVEH